MKAPGADVQPDDGPRPPGREYASRLPAGVLAVELVAAVLLAAGHERAPAALPLAAPPALAALVLLRRHGRRSLWELMRCRHRLRHRSTGVVALATPSVLLAGSTRAGQEFVVTADGDEWVVTLALNQRTTGGVLVRGEPGPSVLPGKLLQQLRADGVPAIRVLLMTRPAPAAGSPSLVPSGPRQRLWIQLRFPTPVVAEQLRGRRHEARARFFARAVTRAVSDTEDFGWIATPVTRRQLLAASVGAAGGSPGAEGDVGLTESWTHCEAEVRHRSWSVRHWPADTSLASLAGALTSLPVRESVLTLELRDPALSLAVLVRLTAMPRQIEQATAALFVATGPAGWRFTVLDGEQLPAFVATLPTTPSVTGGTPAAA